MKKIIYRCFLALSFSLSGCGFVYLAKPIEGWVVDAETGMPIEGVNVAANWKVVLGGLDGSTPRGQLKVLETVSDKEGRFYFPGWGPRIVFLGHLENGASPGLSFFKSGYIPAQLGNDGPAEADLSVVRSSKWSGKKIPLEKHKEDWVKFGLRHSALSGTLGYSYGLSEGCGWRDIRLLLTALERERRALKQRFPFLYTRKMTAAEDEIQLAVGNITTIEHLPEFPEQIFCGSPKKFFKEYLTNE